MRYIPKEGNLFRAYIIDIGTGKKVRPAINAEHCYCWENTGKHVIALDDNNDLREFLTSDFAFEKLKRK